MGGIIADTNFFLSQFEYGVDLPSELLRLARGPLEVIVASGTIDELHMLSGKSGKRAAAARFALSNMELLKKKLNLRVEKSAGKVDDWIINHAKEKSLQVATNDIELRKRLLLRGIKVIALKGKSKLDYV